MTTEANLAPLRQPVHLEDASKHSGNGHAGHGTDSHDHTDNILNKLFRLLREERRDLGVVLAYSIIIGLLSLVIPLSSQAIVNAVALGVFSNQLFVLCAVVAFGVIALGAFTVMEKFVVDVLQRRIFVRTAFEIAYRLPRIKQSSLAGEYAPELVNRFFDVLTVQKTIGKFLLDGVSATLVALIGLLLLAIYHPFFILLDILLLLFAPFIVFVLGRGGLKTSIKESKKKYALAHWLEDIARCQTSFKLSSTPEFIFERVDHIATEYVKARAAHFRVLAWQLAGSAAIRVFATVGVLGIGGSLVISQQLSLGQLVAAELVVLSLMSALEKLVTQFEEHYDLLTAIDKISHITDKPLEPVGGEVLPETNAAASLRLREVSFEYSNGHKVLNHLSLDVPAGGRVSLVGESGAGKSTLTTLLVGLYEPTHGLIEISGRDLSRMDLRSLRKAVGVVLSNNEIFEGTIEENITLGRELNYNEVQWALRTSQIYDEVLSLPQGLQTHLVSAGNNVPDGLLRRIMFARAIAGKPRILVLDEAFSGIEESSRLRLIESLYAEKCWTIIDISHDSELTRRAETVFVLERGHIAEQGSPRELSAKSDSGFVRLFPGLVKQFHESEAARSLADQSIELRLPGGSNGNKKV